MRIVVWMAQEQKFTVNEWWATEPVFVLQTLKAQLEAAKILWPEELGHMEIVDTEGGK